MQGLLSYFPLNNVSISNFDKSSFILELSSSSSSYKSFSSSKSSIRAKLLVILFFMSFILFTSFSKYDFCFTNFLLNVLSSQMLSCCKDLPTSKSSFSLPSMSKYPP